MDHKNARYFFDSLASAAMALIAVLQYARNSDEWFRFGPLNAQQILDSGLRISGEIEGISEKLDDIAGSVRHDD